MKFERTLLALLSMVLLAGCGPADSLNPLYTDKDLVFDQALLGQWQDNDGTYDFAKTRDNGYQLVVLSKDDETGQPVTLVFDAHLVNLEGHRFLDLVCRLCFISDAPTVPDVHIAHTPDGIKIEPHLVNAGNGGYFELVPGESNSNEDRFSLRLLKPHWFFKVVMEDEGRTLKLIQLDDSWIDDQIQRGRLVIDHEMIEGSSAVLTANTRDLQQLVLDHVNDDEAFHGDTVMQRSASSEHLQAQQCREYFDSSDAEPASLVESPATRKLSSTDY